jgi:Family of unknown function (DUF5681)
MSADYEVGYCRPPQHSRFQKGQSGNPRGRPKGARNFATELQEALDQTMVVRQGGAERRISRRGGVVLSLLDRALKGDVRAARVVIEMEQRSDPAKGAIPDGALSTDETEVLEAFERRMRERLLRGPKDEEPGS